MRSNATSVIARHFIEPPKGAADLNACEKVSGAINRVYWCRLFARVRSK